MFVWEHNGVTSADPEQVGHEYDPFRRLSYTWHTMTPKLAQRLGVSEAVRSLKTLIETGLPLA